MSFGKDLNQAIAYFKRVWEDDSSPAIHLPEENTPSHILYSDDLAIFFVLDEGESFNLIMNADLQRNTLSLEELLDIGVRNLREIANEIEVRKTDDYFCFVGNGNFEASLLLIDDIWDEWFPQYCPHGYIAALPARDILAFCDSLNEDGITKLRQIIKRGWRSCDHVLSNRLYTRTNNRWTPLLTAREKR